MPQKEFVVYYIHEHFVGFLNVHSTTGEGLCKSFFRDFDTVLWHWQQYAGDTGRCLQESSCALWTTSYEESSVTSMSFVFGLLKWFFTLLGSSVTYLSNTIVKPLWATKCEWVCYQLPEMVKSLCAQKECAIEKWAADVSLAAKEGRQSYLS